MKKAVHYISPISHRGRTGQASPVSGRLGNRGAGRGGVWQGKRKTARTYCERAEAALIDRGAAILKIMETKGNEH